MGKAEVKIDDNGQRLPDWVVEQISRATSAERVIKPMIMKVRMRDISFEEAMKCCALGNTSEADARAFWGQFKAQEIKIISVPCTEAAAMESPWLLCKGPFYRYAEDPDRVVCVHIAQIGD